MQVLIVSSFPPRRCGIGAYARDQADRLRERGDRVGVLSPPDGDGDLRAVFVGGGAFRRAARVGGRFDRIVVHFQPALYYPPRRSVAKVVTSASLLWLVLRRRRTVELLIHESDPPILRRPDYALLWLAFRLARVLMFHTDAERGSFERAYRMRPGRRARVVAHLVRPSFAAGTVTRARARERLGLTGAGSGGDGGSRRGPMLVCVGFLQPSKGFDRALEAFARVFASGDDGRGEGSASGASLYLVGSVREGTVENRSYVRALRARSQEVAGAHLVERFLPEEEFDLWVVAGDRLVLPYRTSWSSGVLARAHELGTPAIVCDVGGLAEQAAPADVVVEGDEGLVEAFEALGAAARGGAAR
jgi:glycosyltransferase involved in cell wall biosynthesis